MVFHLVVIVISVAAAFWIRFDFSLRTIEVSLLMVGLAVSIPVKMGVFIVGGLQKGSWRYVGLTDLARLALLNTAASVLSMTAILLWAGTAFPRSVYVIDFLLCFLYDTYIPRRTR